MNDDPNIRRPTIPDVLPRFRAYLALRGNEAWGSLHIVLEDGNVSDDSVRACIAYAAERGDAEGEALGKVLLMMSKTQRLKMGGAASR